MPARVDSRLVDRHVEAEQRQVVRGGQAGGAAPDDPNRLALGRVGMSPFCQRLHQRQKLFGALTVAPVLPWRPTSFRNSISAGPACAPAARAVTLGHEPLERPDRTRADPSARGGTPSRTARRRSGHRSTPADSDLESDHVRALEVAVGDRADIAAGVGVHGARRLAVDLSLPIRQVGNDGGRGGRSWLRRPGRRGGPPRGRQQVGDQCIDLPVVE